MSDDKMGVVSAVYAEWQMVKTRGVLKLIFECPIEQTEQVMSVLGVPRPDQECWCAIARLIDGAVRQRAVALPGADRALKQCHALCGTHKFQAWIIPHRRYGLGGENEINEENARKAILDYLQIASRGDILTNKGALLEWGELVGDFRQEMGMGE